MSATRRVSSSARKTAAPGPSNRSRPMCEMSAMPTAERIGQVLLDDRRVLDRHGPAGEIDHPPAVGNVPVIERRFFQRSEVVGHGRFNWCYRGKTLF